MDLRVQLTAKLEDEFFLLVLPVSKVNACCSEDDVDHSGFFLLVMSTTDLTNAVVALPIVSIGWTGVVRNTSAK